MYAKIENGQVVDYPVQLEQIRLTFPNMSFPPAPTDADLAGTGFVNVIENRAQSTATQKAVESAPEFQNGIWVKHYTMVDLDETELAHIADQNAVLNRSQRNHLLAASDYTQMPDYNLATKAAWATYRQALRDLPTTANWPNLEPSDWPVKP